MNRLRWALILCACGIVLAPAAYTLLVDRAPCFHRIYPVALRVGGFLPKGTAC